MCVFRLLLTALVCNAFPAAGQQAGITVKQIGASYLEAPPGREKNLTPNGSFGTQEKVETHAVLIMKDRLIADSPFWRNESKVNAMAILKDKTLLEMGTAEVSSFRKVSEDRRKMLISMSINRLPDQAISGVKFSGTVKVHVAKSELHKVAKFDAKVGSRIELDLGVLTLEKIEANSMTLNGSDQLDQIAAIKITKSDGTVLIGERGGYSRLGDTGGVKVQVQYTFNAPVAPGKIDFTLYDGLTVIDVPVNLIVAKPY